MRETEQGFHPADALVERRQPRSQVGRIAFLHRHLAEASGDLAQGFRPAAGGVGQHHHVMPLVPVVFCQGYAEINRCFPGDHGHVGSVGHQQGAFHEGTAGIGVGQFGEVIENVHQLVAAFAAAHIDDDVGVGPAGDLPLPAMESEAKAGRPQ